jgi:cysteine desulfurase
MTGGGQEKKRRSGTLNVPAIVGFGKAAEIAKRDMPFESPRLETLGGCLWKRISREIEDVTLNGPAGNRLPGNLNVTFSHVEGEALLMALRETAALSTGSACASGTVRGSYVLRALGVPEEEAHSSLRFGLGRGNTEEHVDRVAGHLARAVRRLREISPFVQEARPA